MFHPKVVNSDFAKHLDERGLTPFINCTVDKQSETVTFPLWVPTGKMVGYQRYDWKSNVKKSNSYGRYYTYIADEYRGCVAWGLENLFNVGPLFVVEGIWDAIRIFNCYFDCVAILTNSPTPQLKQYVRNLAGNRPCVSLCDKGEDWHWTDLSFTVPEPYKDVNAMSHDVAFDWLTEVKDKINEKLRCS